MNWKKEDEIVGGISHTSYLDHWLLELFLRSEELLELERVSLPGISYRLFERANCRLIWEKSSFFTALVKYLKSYVIYNFDLAI